MGSSLNRTIVGWKRVLANELYEVKVIFKSHHSGMETYVYLYRAPDGEFFKSHHSGMETAATHWVKTPMHRL